MPKSPLLVLAVIGCRIPPSWDVPCDEDVTLQGQPHNTHTNVVTVTVPSDAPGFESGPIKLNLVFMDRPADDVAQPGATSVHLGSWSSMSSSSDGCVYLEERGFGMFVNHTPNKDPDAYVLGTSGGVAAQDHWFNCMLIDEDDNVLDVAAPDSEGVISFDLRDQNGVGLQICSDAMVQDVFCDNKSPISTHGLGFALSDFTNDVALEDSIIVSDNDGHTVVVDPRRYNGVDIDTTIAEVLDPDLAVIVSNH